MGSQATLCLESSEGGGDAARVREDDRVELWLPAKGLEVSKVGVVVFLLLLESVYNC